MTDLAFVDSNVILYALDKRQSEKSEQAEDVLRSVIEGGSGVASTQVVNEVASVLLRKYERSSLEVVAALQLFRSFHVVAHSLEMTVAAVELRETHKINFWDALIVATAVSAGCRTLYTEDLSHGHKIASLRIVDPFA
jgi:predicted nucleic acid-binding protein